MQLMTLREHDGGALRIRALEGAQVVEQRAQLGAVVKARRDRDHRVLVDTIVNPFCQTLLPQRAIRIRAVRIHAPQWRALALVAETDDVHLLEVLVREGLVRAWILLLGRVHIGARLATELGQVLQSELGAFRLLGEAVAVELHGLVVELPLQGGHVEPDGGHVRLGQRKRHLTTSPPMRWCLV